MKICTHPAVLKPLSMAALAVVLLASGCSGQTDEAASLSTSSTAPAAPGVDSVPVAMPPDAASLQSQQVETVSTLDPAIPEELLVSPAKSGGECGIEVTSSRGGTPMELERSRPENVEGWALHRESVSRASAIFFKLASDGEASYFAPAQPVNRPGLGARLNDATRDDAGFEVMLDLQRVPAGEYVVQIAQRVGDDVLLCDTGWKAAVSE